MSQLDKKMSFSKIFKFVFVIIAVVFLYEYFMYKHNSDEKPVVVSKTDNELIVNVLPFVEEDVVLKNSYIGYVTPIKFVDIVPKISGYIEKVYVTGGQRVKTGDKLIKIDPEQYRASYNAAKASVVQAQANFNNAKIYYKRIKKAGKRAISKTEIDAAKAKYLSAQGALSEAKANSNLAKVNLSYTDLDATIDGVIGNVDLTKGNFISPSSSSLLKIIKDNPIRVVFSIANKEYLNEMEANSDNLFGDKKIKLILSNDKEYSHNGTYQFSSNEIDKSTNSIAIYVDFNNDNNELLANAYVNVILESVHKDGILISKKYVKLNSKGDFIYTIENGKLKRHSIDIVARVGDSYLVDDEFAKDEYLVTDKLSRAKPDTKYIMKLPNDKDAHDTPSHVEKK